MFIAFSTIDQTALGYGDTAEAARAAMIDPAPDAPFVEVLDCGANGQKVLAERIPLYKARELHCA